MKRIIYCSLLSLLALSCSEAVTDMDRDADPVSVITFTPCGGAVTRSTVSGPDGSSRIDHWAVIVFNQDDASDHVWNSSGGGEDITCSVTSGRRYRAYAIANYPEFGEGAFDPSEFSSEEDLLSFSSSLSGNAPDALTMFGCTEIITADGNIQKDIEVSRLAAAIGISRISVDFPREGNLASGSFVLKSIYCQNVFTRCALGQDYGAPPDEDGSLWYNAMSLHGSGTNSRLDSLTSEVDLNETLDFHEGEYVTNHVFYVYPNPRPLDSDTRSATWSSRCTRLVIAASVGGTDYYYPITIPEIKRNHFYHVTEAVIRNLGSLDPEGAIPGAIDVTLSVSGCGWDIIPDISENS